MHRYRTHTCGALRKADTTATSAGRVRLSGWLHRKRDHGNLLFLDLRDRYGITQCVIEQGAVLFSQAEALKLETVVSIVGAVVLRSEETRNPALDTGEVEVRIEELEILGKPTPCPCRSIATNPQEKKCVCATAIWICAVRRCKNGFYYATR